jgi:predicted ribosome quality control (RQC) complex YloA/Tae2 family protein
MPYDSIVTRAVVEDLRLHLLGGRVDKIVQPEEMSVAFLLRAEHANQWLLMSAHALRATVRRTMSRQTTGFSEPTPFVMLLRKYLEGARLSAVTQVGVDRVVRFAFERAAGESLLIAEVIGRYSNVILTAGDSTVLGALKLVRAEENRVRVIAPRRAYAPPPAPMQTPPYQARAKLDPIHGLAGNLAAALSRMEPTALLWKSLLDTVDGLSPTVAREVVFQVTGATDSTVAEALGLALASTLLDLIRLLYSPARGLPCAVRRDEKLVDFAAFPLTYHGIPPVTYPDIMVLLDDVQLTPSVADSMTARRGPVLASLELLRKNARRKIASLQRSLVDEAILSEMRVRGEMVLAFQHAIEAGAKEFVVPDTAVKIALDAQLTPVENAQRFFKQYAKARDASRVVPALLEAARQELEYVDQLAVHAALAADPQSLAAVREDLRDLTSTPEEAAQRAKKAAKRDRRGMAPKGKPGVNPLRVRAADGSEILVGRSAKQNDAVTFDMAGAQDIWLHARRIPGAHVILRTAGQAPSPAALLQAATLAAAHSQARSSTTVPVDYTLVRNVHRIKGGKPGLVHYSGETTLNVRPDAAG